jgi:cytochrome c
MHATKLSLIVAIPVFLLAVARAATIEGNAARGQRVFNACAACHALEPNKHVTGPSLAGLWGRHAGTVPGFERYSPALKNSGVVWDDATLEAWITGPESLIPDNAMTFRGIKDAQARADLLAFLKEATRPGAAQRFAQQPRGMMGAAQVPNLKKLDEEDRVRSIRYCHDSYKVMTADGKVHDYWERNLRFKTDSSDDGPEKGAPAIVGSGMMGDRASVIFATPEEISGFINRAC